MKSRSIGGDAAPAGLAAATPAVAGDGIEADVGIAAANEAAAVEAAAAVAVWADGV
jgi:hypothetical protein